VSATHAVPNEPLQAGRKRVDHAMARVAGRRLCFGVLTLWMVSVLIFAATQVLPGNAAVAILGHNSSATAVRALDARLHLNQPVVSQYLSWLGRMLTGHPGTSLVTGQPVWSVVGPRLANSAVLVVVAGLLGTLIGVVLGAVSALRRNSVFDHVVSVVSLAATALPEFIVAILLIIVFATVVVKLFPAVSLVPQGQYAWQTPKLLILPVATLVIVIVPYILRMMRAATIEALESEYVEMARLKGLPTWRVVIGHALPNAVAPTIQVVGLTFLYLAGGIVVVEYVFAFPGIGQGLVNAVSDRDIPEIQFIVLALASFYVVVNIITDLIALAASPRHRGS
jgi:peptide/nickel transport system permease protein